ncbi:MAG: hypothetical protein ACERKJ_12270, partial [Candidatus Dadabacteria bacterium]
MENETVEGQDQVVSETTSDTSQEQSETTEDVGKEAESKMYNVLGRDVSSDELFNEYTKTQTYITKLQQEAATREAKVQKEAASAVSENELLQNVDPNVKEAISRIVTPIIQSALQQKDEAAEKEAKDRELKQSFADAEKKHDGKDGYPKFVKTAVTQYMLDNEVYDPERAYNLMNQAAIID